MPIHELVKQFRQLHTLATSIIPDEIPRATNADLEGKPLPLTLWETENVYRNDTLIEVHVHPITVTRFGIDHSVGATAPSISFRDRNRTRCIGSADLFYTTKELAQAEADRNLAWTKKDLAIKELQSLVITDLPELLERFEK